MERNLLKSLGATVLLLFVWNYFGLFGTVKQVPVQPTNIPAQMPETQHVPPSLNPRPGSETGQGPEALSHSPSLGSTSTNTHTLIPDHTTLESKVFTMDTPAVELTLTNKGASIESLVYKKYAQRFNFNQPGTIRPLTLLNFGQVPAFSHINFNLEMISEKQIDMTYTLPGEFKLTCSLSATEQDYLFNYTVNVTNLSDRPIYFDKGFQIHSGALSSDTKAQGPYLNFTYIDESKEVINRKHSKVDALESKSGYFKWVGVQNNTFTQIIHAATPFRFINLEKYDEHHIGFSAQTEDFSILPADTYTSQFNLYLGPKLYFHMEPMNLGIERVIDYGSILGPLTKSIVFSLNYFHDWVKNYGLAIIILTIILKMLTYPLTKISVLSARKIQEIAPLQKQLQAKHKSDPKVFQMELMKLYKEKGVNPLGGCLPLVIQIPIFISFYSAINNSIELQNATFLYIKDLGSPDKLFTVGPLAFNLLPILMGLTQYFSMKQQPPSSDPQQQKIMTMFTFFFPVICYMMPSGLVLYFTVSNLIGIYQTYLIKKIK